MNPCSVGCNGSCEQCSSNSPQSIIMCPAPKYGIGQVLYYTERDKEFYGFTVRAIVIKKSGLYYTGDDTIGYATGRPTLHHEDECFNLPEKAKQSVVDKITKQNVEAIRDVWNAAIHIYKS